MPDDEAPLRCRQRPVLILSGPELVRALPMGALIDALAAAFVEAAEGHAVVPTRVGVPVEEHDALLAVMPAYLRSGALATKVNTLFRRNPAAGRPLIQGVVLLCDSTTGTPLALFESGSLTARRTAAGAAVATRAVARPDARVLAIIGAGIEARTHLEAIAHVRKLRDVRVCARSVESAQRFADAMAATRVPIRAVGSPREAVEGADLIVTVSTSAVPVLAADWIADGAHICGVGSHSPAARELDGATVARADLIVVDTLDGCRAEAGDLILPIKDGLLAWDRVRHLGDVLRGAAPGRTGASEITLYKSVGTGLMDAAAARLAYSLASANGLGVTVPF